MVFTDCTCRFLIAGTKGKEKTRRKINPRATGGRLWTPLEDSPRDLGLRKVGMCAGLLLYKICCGLLDLRNAVPLPAQEDSFQWESDWNVMGCSLDGTIPILRSRHIWHWSIHSLCRKTTIACLFACLPVCLFAYSFIHCPGPGVISFPRLLDQYKVLDDYEKKSKSEISLTAGYIVEVIEKRDQGNLHYLLVQSCSCSCSCSSSCSCSCPCPCPCLCPNPWI